MRRYTSAVWELQVAVGAETARSLEMATKRFYSGDDDEVAPVSTGRVVLTAAGAAALRMAQGELDRCVAAAPRCATARIVEMTGCGSVWSGWASGHRHIRSF